MSTLLPLLVTGVALGSVLAVLSLGFAISYWPSRQFHFAFGSVFIAGTYALWDVTSGLGAPLVVGILASFLVSIVVGLACYYLFYKPLANEQTVFLTSFALSIAVQNVIQIAFSANPQSVNEPSFLVNGAFSIGSAQVTVFQVVEVCVCLGVWFVVEMFLRHTRAGVGLRALSSDRFLTESVGIETGRLLAGAYALGSVLAAVGAILFAFDVGLAPDSYTTPLFYAINAVLIGGTYSITGSAIGGMLIGIVVNLAVWKVPSQWQTAIAFGVLFIVLIVRPQGILAKKG